MAESFFSRLRRAEIGTHHHIAGPYLASYAAEMDWREDNRRVANGDQYRAIVAAARYASDQSSVEGLLAEAPRRLDRISCSVSKTILTRSFAATSPLMYARTCLANHGRHIGFVASFAEVSEHPFNFVP